MNFDKVTNPMMKAFFQRLSNQIDKSDIPDGGPSQTTSPVTEVEPDETQILKDAIAKLQQDLDESNSKVQSQNSEIDKLKQEVDTADLDYTLLKFERDNFETKSLILRNRYQVSISHMKCWRQRMVFLRQRLNL